MSLRTTIVPPLLRENTEFRRFFTGQAVSLFGDQVSLLALPLTAVLVLHAGATQMSVLTTLNLAPALLFSLHAGAWVDRIGHRRLVMIASDLGRALAVAVVPFAFAFHHLSFALLYGVAFVTGTLSVLFNVGNGGFFQAIVEREDYLAGSALLNGNRAVAAFAGPSIGGIVVQALRAPYALAVDALSFVWSAACLLRVRVSEPPTATADDGGVLAGARWLRRSPVMLPELLGVATINYFNFVFFALFVLYATRSLHVHPATLGLVLGAGAIGAVGGSLVTGRLSRRIGLGPAFALGCVLFPAPIVLVPAAGGPRWLVLACLFVAELGSGVGVMILDITAGTFTAALVPAALRSRVAGAFMVVNYGVRPLGTITAGILGSTIGIRPTLWLATVGALAGILFVVPSPIMQMRELPEAVE